MTHAPPAIAVLAHAAPHAHAEPWWAVWNPDPLILGNAAVLSTLYAVGLTRMWRSAGVGHGVSRLRAAAFAAGVAIDDATRTTPTATILPHVIDELHSGGVSDDRIEFLQAPGTHRPMTDDELRRKLGGLSGRYRVHEHHWLDRRQLHEFGRTSDGTPVTANRLLTRFDFVLGVGAIVPHRIKGLSGGAKIMFPGVSGRELMDVNQWDASLRMSQTVMGRPDNPMRRRMEEAARIAGLSCIVNVVTDADDRIVGCFAGDFVAAHRAGVRPAREVYGVVLPSRADIAVIDSHPADRDFWQSAKAAYAATIAVRDGGSLVLVSPNPEGVATNHRNVMDIGFRPHAELVAMADRGADYGGDLVGLAVLADVSRIAERIDCIMASPGIRPDEAARLGFRHAADPAEGLRMARERQGPGASVAVIRHGGHVLPIIADEPSEGLPD